MNLYFFFKYLKTPEVFYSNWYFSYFKFKNKYNVLYDYILYNPFILKEQREELLYLFNKLQKIYFIIKKFGKKLYIKRNVKKIENEYDISYTKKLENINNDKLIYFIENNRIYTFYSCDIVKIICYSLLYHEELFALPKYPNNPHTNIPISKVNLYNIYFQLIKNKYIIPEILYWFYKSDFTINVFIINYESNLRDINLIKYYNDINDDEKYNIILNMIKCYKRSIMPNLYIHKSFPKADVVNAFKDILPQYGLSICSYNPSKKLQAKKKVRDYLKLFYKNNKFFGRVIYILNK